MEREGRLEGKVALVTGVAKTNSIGFATCCVFADEGAALAIVDIADKVHECAELLHSRGCEISAHTADLIKFDQVRTAVGDASLTTAASTYWSTTQAWQSAAPTSFSRVSPRSLKKNGTSLSP